MTATYDPTLPTDKDLVRLYISDTDAANAEFQDEAIEAILTIEGSPLLAAARLADSLAAQYSSRSDLTIDGFSIKFSDRAEAYRDLADSLRASAAAGSGGLAAPVITGVSLSAMQSVASNTDRPPNKFELDMFRNPNTWDDALD